MASARVAALQIRLDEHRDQLKLETARHPIDTTKTAIHERQIDNFLRELQMIL